VGKAKKTGKPRQASTAKKTATSSGAATAKSAHSTQKSDPTILSADRRAALDRRSTLDRRKKTEPVAVERRVLQRRAKVNRRRQIDPTTCERDYTPDEIEFMNAMDDYKRQSGRMFPTCSEVLEVIKKLGYEKCPDSRALDRVAPALGGGHSHGPGSEATAV
jgi:hypothetical protein